MMRITKSTDNLYYQKQQNFKGKLLTGADDVAIDIFSKNKIQLLEYAKESLKDFPVDVYVHTGRNLRGQATINFRMPLDSSKKDCFDAIYTCLATNIKSFDSLVEALHTSKKLFTELTKGK